MLEALRHVRRPFNDVDAWDPAVTTMFGTPSTVSV
jgi:hypothetical protein